MRRLKYIIGAGVLLLVAVVQAAVTEWNFDDGTAQGWTEIMGATAELPANESRHFAVGNNFGNYAPPSGDYGVLQVNGDANFATNTLLWRSPVFTLDGSGPLTAYLTLGDMNGVPPATSALVSPIATTSGFMGIALRRVSDNAYLLWTGRTESNLSWEQVSLTEAQLYPYVSPTEEYTLDLIDSRSGGWGHIYMDSVVIGSSDPLADTTFNANTTGSWTDGTNWTAGVPSSTDIATVSFGAFATLDTAAEVQVLAVKETATLELADGGVLTVSSNVLFQAGATNIIGIGSGTSSGALIVDGALDVSGAFLVVDGVLDGDERVIAVASNGITGEFSNYPQGTLVQSGIPNYFIEYVTTETPNYIAISSEPVTTVTASSQNSALLTGGAVENIINESGMTGDLHAYGNWANMWVGGNGDVENAWVRLDLGASFDLESMMIWNCNDGYTANGFDPTYVYRSVTQADLYVSNVANPGAIPTNNASSADWTLIVADQAFNLATGAADLAATDTFDLSGNTARYVAIKVDANGGVDPWGQLRASLSEVRVVGEKSSSVAGTIGDISMEMISGTTNMVFSWEATIGAYYGLQGKNRSVVAVLGHGRLECFGIRSSVSVTSGVSDAVNFYRGYVED